MKEVLIGLCYFAGAAVMAALAIDIGITAYHRANGTPTAQKVLEQIVAANAKTIDSQRNTIKAQQSEIRIHKQRIAELETKINSVTEYAENLTGGNYDRKRSKSIRTADKGGTD